MEGVKLDQYMGITEAAEYLGVKPRTLKNWCRKDQITFFKHPISNRKLFKKEDLDQLFIEEYE